MKLKAWILKLNIFESWQTQRVILNRLNKEIKATKIVGAQIKS